MANDLLFCAVPVAKDRGVGRDGSTPVCLSLANKKKAELDRRVCMCVCIEGGLGGLLEKQ